MYVEMRNIYKQYGNFRASDNVSFGIEKGKLAALLGPSGSGKTTLLRMIAGLENPNAGDIFIDGKRVNDIPAAKRGIGFVFQSYALFRYMTVFDNIAFGLKIKNKSKAYIDDKIKYALKLVNLNGFEHRSIDSLSGGQQQRIAIARAIVNEPKVLLLDEPLGALDLKLRQDMQYELIRLKNELGITFIYVTHDQTEAMTLGDRIVIMKDGVIQQIGTPQEVFDHPVNLFVAGFIGVPQMNFYDAELKRDEDGVYSVLMGGIRVVPTVEKQERLYQASVPPQEIILGVRPEHIMLLENGEHGVHGKVEVSEMMGSAVHLHVDINGRDSIIVAQTSGMDGAQYIPSESGTSISFIFGGNVVHLFSKKDGHNLEF